MVTEFQGMSYNSQSAMLAAIAYEWMTAGGANSPQVIDDMGDLDAAECAAECIRSWDLDDEWLEDREIDVEDIERAFADFIVNRPDIAAAIEEG